MNNISMYPKLFKRIFKKDGLPLQLIFFITDQCNCKCKHCFLKGQLNNSRNLLRLEEIEKISCSMADLLSLSLTGGEPFMREDIVEIVRLFVKNAKVKNIVTITNGIDTSKILTRTESMIHVLGKNSLMVSVSIDGIDKAHDDIRQFKGAFEKANKTLKELLALSKRHSNLIVGTSTTCAAQNQKNLKDLYKYLRSMGVENIGINLVRPNVWNEDFDGPDISNYDEITNIKLNDLARGMKEYAGLWASSFFKAKEAIQYRLISSIYKNKCFMTPCCAGSVVGVLWWDGNVFPCEMLKNSMGNIRESDYNFKELWFSKKAKECRNFIKTTKCFCTYECVMTGNILLNARFYPELLMRTLLKYE